MRAPSGHTGGLPELLAGVLGLEAGEELRDQDLARLEELLGQTRRVTLNWSGQIPQ